jgi:sulfite reductase (NADPH) hemoprotein beta-component
MSRNQVPTILTANDLLEGDAVFLGFDGWVRDHRAARVAHDEAEAAALKAIGAADKARALVVDPYLVEVALGPDGSPTPLRYRELLRTRGPSVRLDLGKQAALRANALL